MPVELKVWNGSYPYNEIGQQHDIKFSIGQEVNGVINELHHPWKCRDYLNEVLYGSQKKMNCARYGFTWKGKEHQFGPGYYLIIYFGSKDLKDTFCKNYPRINEIEAMNKWPLNNFMETTVDSRLVIPYNKQWFNNTFFGSLYTYLLKCLAFPSFIENIHSGTNEYEYMKHYTLPKFKIMIQNLNLFKTRSVNHLKQKNPSMFLLHDYSGFVSTYTTKYSTLKPKLDKLFASM